MGLRCSALGGTRIRGKINGNEFISEETIGPPFSDILGGKDFGWALNRGQIPLISYIGENLSGSNTVNFLYRGKFILSPNTVNFLYRGKFILSLNRGVTKSGVTK
eukprot:sb/3477954/